MAIIKENINLVNSNKHFFANKLNFGDELLIEGKHTLGHVRVVGSDFHYDTYSSDAEYSITDDEVSFFSDSMDGGICQIGDALDAIIHHLEMQTDLD